jgi:drug/metabolite transporter (DMT)-like permease
MGTNACHERYCVHSQRYHPIVHGLVAHYFSSDEKATTQRLAGVIAGLAGVATITGGAALEATGVGVIAQLAILLAALLYAFAGIFGRCFHGSGTGPLVSAAGQVTASSMMLVPVMLLLERPWELTWLSVNAIGAVCSLALLSTALAYVIYFRILAAAGATNLLLVTFLIPVSAILLGVLVLGESLEAKHSPA